MRAAVAYIRRSAPGASLSYEEQRAAIHAHAARYGDTALEEVIDAGKSGADQTNALGGTGRGGRRRAFASMRERIAAGGVATLYAYNLSRLARSTREMLALAEACASTGTVLRTVKEGEQDFTTPSGRLFLTLLAAIATFEAESASDRTTDRVAAQRGRGEYVGRPPYGFQIIDGQLVSIPAQRAIIERVIAEFRAHGTYESTAAALNGDDIKSPTGIWWRAGTVRRILDREGILGPQQGRVKGSRNVPTAVFARLLYCAQCGCLLSPVRKVRAKSEWIGYSCTRGRFTRDHASPHMISERLVRAWAIEESARLTLPFDAIEETERDTAAMAAIEVRRGRLVDLYTDGVVSRAIYNDRLARLDAETAAIEAKVRVLPVPASIDFEQPAETVQPILAALWDRVTVDLAAKTFTADWAVPEWRRD